MFPRSNRRSGAQRPRLLRNLLVGPLLAAAFLLGCEIEEESGAPTEGEKRRLAAATAAVVSRHCLQCHDGASSAPPLATPDALQAQGPAIADAVSNNRMPPWQIDPGCNSFANVSILSDEERQAVAAWAEAGFPAPEPSLLKPPAAPLLSGTALHIWAAEESYAFPDGSGEMVRCHRLGVVGSEPLAIVASSVAGSALPYIHHMNLAGALSVNPNRAGCSSQEVPIGGVAPGVPRFVLPRGTAIVVPPGTILEAEVHYARPAGVAEVPPLRPEVRFWTLPASTPGLMPVSALGVNVNGFTIPAGAASFEVSESVAMPTAGRIIGIIPHMHELGAAIDVEVETPDPAADSCLVRVNQWAFRHQEYYLLAEPDWLAFEAGDVLRVRCTYDNSALNQPTDNGVRREPRDVRYGPKTADEMCQASIWVVPPRP